MKIELTERQKNQLRKELFSEQELRELRLKLIAEYREDTMRSTIATFCKWVENKNDLHVVMEDPLTGNWVPVLEPKFIIDRFMSEKEF